MANVGQIFEYLNELAPVGLKMDFDMSGCWWAMRKLKLKSALLHLI